MIVKASGHSFHIAHRMKQGRSHRARHIAFVTDCVRVTGSERYEQ
jgi:hypothetical protein